MHSPLLLSHPLKTSFFLVEGGAAGAFSATASASLGPFFRVFCAILLPLMANQRYLCPPHSFLLLSAQCRLKGQEEPILVRPAPSTHTFFLRLSSILLSLPRLVAPPLPPQKIAIDNFRRTKLRCINEAVGKFSASSSSSSSSSSFVFMHAP